MKEMLRRLLLLWCICVPLCSLAGEPTVSTLLSSALADVDGKNVVVSRVDIPPNSALPKHFHPGEEIAFVLEGEVTLWQLGKEDTVTGEGGLVGIPARHIHTGISGVQGVRRLVFRILDDGQPCRVRVV